MHIADSMVKRVTDEAHVPLVQALDASPGFRAWLTEKAREELLCMASLDKAIKRPTTLRSRENPDPNGEEYYQWVDQSGDPEQAAAVQAWCDLEPYIRKDKKRGFEDEYPLGRRCVLVVVLHNHEKLVQRRIPRIPAIAPVARDEPAWAYLTLLNRKETWPAVDNEAVLEFLSESVKAVEAAFAGETSRTRIEDTLTYCEKKHAVKVLVASGVSEATAYRWLKGYDDGLVPSTKVERLKKKAREEATKRENRR